jgi:putative solute:sodium symporter small subunit
VRRLGWEETYFNTAQRILARRMHREWAWNKGGRQRGSISKDVIGSGAMPRRPRGKDAKMLHDVTKLRRVTARAIRNQPGLAALPRTMGVLLTVWLVYFFAINLFAKQLDTIQVPYLEVPLSAYLAALGAFAVFGAAVYVLTRAIRAR